MSDEELNTRQTYCLLRRRGYTDEEAAEKAGFSGRPGPDARRLLAAVAEEAGEGLRDRRLELEREISRLEFRLQRKQRRLEAVEVLFSEKEM